MKKIITVIIIMIIVIICHFIFSPLYFITFDQFIVHKLHNLTQARNYYTIIASATSAFVGCLGILFGYFYYIDKNVIDERKNKSDRRRSRIALIVDQLNKYDEYVDEILGKRFDDSKKLDFLRSKIIRGPEIIRSLMIDNEFIGFVENDISTILDVFAYVEKNEYISNMAYEAVRAYQMDSIKFEYIDKIQEARKVCYLKTQ